MEIKQENSKTKEKTHLCEPGNVSLISVPEIYELGGSLLVTKRFSDASKEKWLVDRNSASVKLFSNLKSHAKYVISNY